MIDRLVRLRSPRTRHWCWGYSFPWQGRKVLVQAGEPNLVCTVFVANALLDAYEENRDPQHLVMAVSSAGYILETLYWDTGTEAGFSYPQPELHSKTHNANFLAAALFCRVHKHTGEIKFLDPALKSARYSASKQHSNGSWPYGEESSQQWIDNF